MNHPYYITKQVEFAGAHRLYKESLSEEENRKLYGPCANPVGHGHNYILEATFKGYKDPVSEFVVHYSDIKKVLNELVVQAMDHRHFNHDVEFLKGILPTSENIVSAIWNRIEKAISEKPYKLYKLRFASTNRSWVEYYGPNA